MRIQVELGGRGTREFLYDCVSTSEINQIRMDIIEIANLQSKILCLCLQLEPRLVLLRGNAKAIPLTRALSDAKAYVSKDQVLHSRPLSPYALRQHIQKVERECVEIHQLLEFSDINQLQQIYGDVELFQEDSTQLWWARKELLTGKDLCDYIGRNEKTKIILKLKSSYSHPT